MSISERKIKSLIDDGHEEIGELIDENNRMVSRIADLEDALKIAVVNVLAVHSPPLLADAIHRLPQLAHDPTRE